MNIGNNLKQIRKSRNHTQQEMADIMFVHRTSYSKMESGQQDISVEGLVRVAKNFGMSIDDIIFLNEKTDIPNEISMEDKATLEQLQLINELEKEEKNILLKLIETFVSKKRFKDYVQKNIASL